MSPEDWLVQKCRERLWRWSTGHPGGLPWLSEADRRLQVQSDLPWWLHLPGAIHKLPVRISPGGALSG